MLSQVKAEHDNMLKLMHSLDASGPETESVYHMTIIRQLDRIQNGDGKGPVVPRSGKDWGVPGFAKKGSKLGRQATRVCESIRYAVSCDQWREVCEWARSVCTRSPVTWID